MNYKVSKRDFVQVLVDCKGESVEEAEGVAEEYRNDLGAYVGDIGGDENSLEEAKAFLGKSKPIVLRKGTDKATALHNTRLLLD